jgi:hypothetical protein
MRKRETKPMTAAKEGQTFRSDTIIAELTIAIGEFVLRHNTIYFTAQAEKS